VAISPYHKEHYFVAFVDRSIKYNFKGAPKEWMALMTDVFEAWAAEGLQKQPLPPTELYVQPNAYAQQYPYAQQQLYPQELYQPVEAMYKHSPSQAPVQLDGNPIAYGVPSPVPSHTSPIPQTAMPYKYESSQGGAVEMPAELPGGALLAAPVSVPVQNVTAEVSSSSLVLLS
jgi:hypothetical protein